MNDNHREEKAAPVMMDVFVHSPEFHGLGYPYLEMTKEQATKLGEALQGYVGKFVRVTLEF